MESKAASKEEVNGGILLMQITKEIASADGLSNDDITMVAQLVDTWARHLPTNVLRDSYYNGDMGVKD